MPGLEPACLSWSVAAKIRAGEFAAWTFGLVQAIHGFDYRLRKERQSIIITYWFFRTAKLRAGEFAAWTFGSVQAIHGF